MADPRGRAFNRGQGKWHRREIRPELRLIDWSDVPLHRWLKDIIDEANRGAPSFICVAYQTPSGKVLISSTRRGYLEAICCVGLPQISLTLAAWDAQVRKWEAAEGVLDKIDAWKARAEELLE